MPRKELDLISQMMVLPDQIMAMASDRGFIHIIGRPTALSQYGREYFVLANGVEIEEGSAVNIYEIEGALPRWAAMLDEMQADGQTAIVWRRQPELEKIPHGKPYVRMRLHFQWIAHLRPTIAWEDGASLTEPPDAA